MAGLRNAFTFFYGIPLSTTLLVGDTVKICGMVSWPKRGYSLTNETFYVTVSYFTCTSIDRGGKLSTLIPVASYPIDERYPTLCFSESVTLGKDLFGCTTFLVVGMNAGSDSEAPPLGEYRFTYTLQGTKACVGQNMIISLCCDPAYTEIIGNNGLVIGSTFSDDSKESYCWTIVAYTSLDVTGSRTAFNSSWTDCTDCLADNPCPENLKIESCCKAGEQIFTSALPGVTVGDTFVDTFGFCWSVIGTAPFPITNVVTVGTVYATTTCVSETCTNNNACPPLLKLVDCCNGLVGYTTEALLGISVTINDVFIDTFGMCWVVADDDAPSTFPNLNFIVGSTNYGADGCTDCLATTDCPVDLYYTVQNCCTEDIEVVLLPAQYEDGTVLGIITSTGAGCYKVLYWSNIGTATLTPTNVDSFGSECATCIEQFLQNNCGVGLTQCCKTWQDYTGQGRMTGYLCDGTWVLNGTNSTYCMSAVIQQIFFQVVDNCCFTIYNPSTTVTIYVKYADCNGTETDIYIAPLSNGPCVSCVLEASGPWDYIPGCN
jgi:hypothetical protein